MTVLLYPEGSEMVTLTVSASTPGTFTGAMIAYDMTTGCVYDRLVVTLVVQ